jgi:hypothetical protein
MKKTDPGKAAPRWTDIVTAASAVVVTLTAVIGTCYVRQELSELTRQNSYLERTMRQTYRPLGVAKFKEGEQDQSIVRISYFEATKVGRLSFIMERQLSNQGHGLMSYIGFVYYVKAGHKPIDFRDSLLAGALDTLYFDNRYHYSRRTPVLPGRSYRIDLVCQDIVFDPEYVLYTLLLYEDQDGVLYDTDRLDIIKFGDKPEISEGMLKPKLTQGFESREVYHTYSDSERQAMVDAIRRFNHPLADALAQKPAIQ